MANLSSAFGTLAIEQQSLDDLDIILEKFVKYQHGYWNYGAYFERYAGGLTFDGTGRWTFDRVVQDQDWFFDTEHNKFGKQIVDCFLQNPDKQMYIDFSDEEAGCNVLYTAEGYSYIDDGKLMFNLNYDDSYEYTNPNLIKPGFYDEYYDDRNEMISEAEDWLNFKLTKHMIDVLDNKLAEPKCSGVLLEYEMDSLLEKLRVMKESAMG